MFKDLNLAKVGFIIQCIGTFLMFIPIFIGKPFPDFAIKILLFGLFLNLGYTLFSGIKNKFK